MRIDNGLYRNRPGSTHRAILVPMGDKQEAMGRVPGAQSLLVFAALVVFGCGEDEGPTTVHPPVTLSGVFDADWEPRQLVQGDVQITPVGDYLRVGQAIIDSLGRFAMGVVPGEYNVEVDLPYSWPMFLNQEGQLTAERSVVSILASEGSLHWEPQAYRILFDFLPDHGADRDWLLVVEHDSDTLFRDHFRPTEGAPPLRNLPGGTHEINLTTPWGEVVSPILSEDGDELPHFEVGPSKERQYVGAMPAPFFIRVVADGLPDDLRDPTLHVSGYRQNGSSPYASTQYTNGRATVTFPVFDSEPLRLRVAASSNASFPASNEREWWTAAPGDTIVASISFGELVIEVHDENIDLEHLMMTLYPEGSTYIIQRPATRDAAPGTLRLVAKEGKYRVALQGCTTENSPPRQWLRGTEEESLIEIRASETTHVSWTPWDGTTISGALSRPLMEHEVLQFDGGCPGYSPFNTTIETSESGDFRIDHIGYEPIRLWARIGEYRRFYYYPGTFEFDEAEVILVDSHDGIEGLFFELP